MKKNIYKTSDKALLKRISDNIISLRKKKDISQEELADSSEINRTYMGNIERCETNPSILKLKKISDSLSVDILELFKTKK